jgi:hypothetical protein
MTELHIHLPENAAMQIRRHKICHHKHKRGIQEIQREIQAIPN